MHVWVLNNVQVDRQEKSMPLTRYSERCWALKVFFVCVGNWFLCLNVCCLDAENVKSFVITHSITEKIPISPYCRLKTWKCWLITARYSWAESQGLVAELLRPACLVTVSLVWEPWPTLGWLDQTDDRAETRTCLLGCRVRFSVSVHQQNSFRYSVIILLRSSLQFIFHHWDLNSPCCQSDE